MVPTDFNSKSHFTFSNYVFLLRRSKYAKRLLTNWKRFAYGLCKNGNFGSGDKYTWYYGDQPGLWYAMMQTDAEFRDGTFKHKDPVIHCNATTGLLDTDWWVGMNKYFKSMNSQHGHTSADLNRIPTEQHIVFSSGEKDVGLGANTFGDASKIGHTAFGLHLKSGPNTWPLSMQHDLRACKTLLHKSA